MRPRTFYRLSLFLPWLIPLFALRWVAMYMMLEIDAVLIIFLAFGGFAYLFFSAALFYWFGKQRTASNMRALTYKAPLLFIPVQLIFGFAWYYMQIFSNHELVVGWEGIPYFMISIIVVGYFYVVAIDIIYYLFNKFGWMREERNES